MIRMGGLVLSAVMVLAAASVGRADTEIWQCDGNNIEGLGVSSGENGVTAGISWDCWGGGGICERNVNPVVHNLNGKMYVRAQAFTLMIDTQNVSSDGTHPGHISATDEGPSDQGGGLSIDETVSCTQGS